MPQRSLCHAVTPISPGWKSLTSDPWAVTSWEIQCSEGGQRDKERHAEVRAEPECRYWTAFIVVIFGFGSCESQKRTMTLTMTTLVGGLNGTYKRVCSGDSRGSNFPMTLTTGWLIEPSNVHKHTHALTHVQANIITHMRTHLVLLLRETLPISRCLCWRREI